MKTRYSLIRRGLRGGGFYCVDTNTGKRTSLGTSIKDDARQIVEAKTIQSRDLSASTRLPPSVRARTAGR